MLVVNRLEAIVLDSTSFYVQDDDLLKTSSKRVILQSGLPLVFEGDMPVSRVAFRQAGMDRLRLFVKRSIDITGALAGLILLAPLFLFIACAIKLTSTGPVFFVQEREGLRGRLFSALKFRTMTTDLCDKSGITHTKTDDPRITELGRFLRKTSIDELPQLINILKGEMSLVGPRPHVPGMLVGREAYKSVVPYYHERLNVAPGLTGWSQVSGLRGGVETPLEAKARVDHDIAYLQNLSIRLDLQIIVKTIAKEFVTGSGY